MGEYPPQNEVNTMKKIILALAAVLTASGVFADGKSDEILKALQTKAAGFGDYRVEFSVTIDGKSLGGVYEVSGERFRIVTPDVEVYSDGRTKFEVSLPDREVLVDAVDMSDRTILGNPTRLFDFLGGSYAHSYKGKSLVSGINCDEIELREPNAKEGEKLTAFVSASTGLPVRLVYWLDNLNTDAIVDIVKITPNIKIDESVFGFDPRRFEGFEIIDFR